MPVMRIDGLPAALDRARQAGLPPVIWLYGDEPLLALEAGDSVRALARELGFHERQVFTAERGFKVESLAHEADALSLFASRRLLELRMTGKPGKELGEALAALSARLPEDVRLLVTSARLDRAATESAWHARVAQTGWAIPIPTVDRAQLPRWLTQRLARSGQSADADTLRLIAERVEGNLLAAHQEVQKLALLFPAGPMPAADVRAAVLDVARYDVFDLIDAMLAGDAARCLRGLHGLRAEGTAAPVVLWAVSDCLRTLVRLSLARDAGRPLPQAMRELRIWGERERWYPQTLQRLGPQRPRQLLREAARIDRMAKGLLRQDAWQGLESVVLAVAGAPVLALDGA